MTKGRPQEERTNVTKLPRNRQSGKYYARVKVNGKQKWRTLEMEVFTVSVLVRLWLFKPHGVNVVPESRQHV